VLQTAVVGPLLEAIRNRTRATGVYFYRFAAETDTLYLTASAGADRGPNAGGLRGPVVSDHFRRESPIVIHQAAWTDQRFTIFPEVLEHRLEGIISIPLIHNGATMGLLNIGRAEPASLPAGEVAALFGLSLPMGALLAAEIEYSKLSERLADRKILDRAKGVLQARLAWTEEQAYVHLRRTSRRRRIKIRDVAREVVELGASQDWEARHAS
jgi:signal transduction protein with GAF and PtsI domain